MEQCPACSSTRVYPSRHRGVGERLHQLFTEKRPYRCHACGWRQWMPIDVHIPSQPDIDPSTLAAPHPDRPVPDADLDRLDLPGAERIGRPHPDAERPLPDEKIDALDPD